MAWWFVREKQKLLEGLTNALKAEETRTRKFVQKMEQSRGRLHAKENSATAHRTN